MGKYKITDPDGNPFVVQASSPEEAYAAFGEMKGGQPRNFDQGFNPSAPHNAAAQRPDVAAGLDQSINGEADDRGRWATAGNALTMGAGDEIMGLLGGGITFIQGKGFDEGYGKMTGAVRNDIANYSERHPVESTAINIGAGLVPLVAGGMIGKGIAAAVPAIGKLAATAGPVATSTLGGTAAGAVTGFAGGEGGIENRAVQSGIGAGIGAVTGNLAGHLGQKIGQWAGSRAGMKASPPPTNNAIEDAAQANFKAAENAGVVIKDRPLKRLAYVRDRLQGTNRNLPRLRPNLHENALEALDVLDNVAQQPTITFADIITTRQTIRDAVNKAYKADPGGADARFADEVLDRFDEWRNGLTGSDIYPGAVSAREANKMLDEANRLWTIKKKGDTISDLVFRAEGEIGSAGFEKSLRQQFKQLAKNPKRFGQFSPDEQEAIRRVNTGGPIRSLLKGVDAMMPPPNLAASASILLGDITPAAMAAGGSLSRAGINKSTRNALQTVENTVNSGGQLPFDPIAAKAAGDYAGLLNAAGQSTTGQIRPGRIDVMFPNDLPVYR